MKGHTYLYFINARTHGKITRQWKSALKEACFSVNIVGGAARGMKGGAKKDSAPTPAPQPVLLASLFPMPQRSLAAYNRLI